jgi:Zn-dependent protease/CBS domain-containing protein
MGGSLRLFTFRGVPISIHASWLIIYALITWTLAVGYFPRALPDMPTAVYWINGLIAALMLFASVLLHELSHSIVAMGHGLGVGGITLHVFGGVSQLEDEPPTPRAEFLIAVVGPLTSFGVAALLWIVGATGLVPAGSPAAILTYLIIVNIFVGIFNLIPGFPLDGGRLLRAALWKWTRSLPRATYLASRAGMGFAFGLIALGVLQILSGAFLGGVWFVILGLFLRSAADVGYVQVALREALAPLRVDRIMARDVVTVDADASVADLVDRFWTHHFSSFPVVDREDVVGIASVGDVHRVASDAWPSTSVRQVMRPLGEDLLVAPSASVFQAFEKAGRNQVGRLAVVDRGRLVGYLALKDITHVLVLQGLGDGSQPAAIDAGRAPLRRAA